jgi:intein/homing endonuclease
MPVLTPEGSKAIEQIRVGDLVLSSPEKVGAGQIGARRIKEVTRGRAKLVGITVGGHLIQASREHPFFVRGESWTSASSLSVGDLLRTHDGRWVQIEEVAEGPESLVYNVRVEENRTYFVGSGDWGFSLWVRDSCGITKQRRALPSLVATEAARD